MQSDDSSLESEEDNTLEERLKKELISIRQENQKKVEDLKQEIIKLAQENHIVREHLKAIGFNLSSSS